MYIALYIRCCPVCGKDIMDQDRVTSGHVRHYGTRISYSRCKEHWVDLLGIDPNLKDNPDRKGTDRVGYCGEWEEKLGMMAQITEYDEQGSNPQRKWVTII